MRTETEARDGVWTVGDAGEVHFVLRDGVFQLGEVIDYQGWLHALRRVDDDAIELEFVGGAVSWEFAAHYHQGTLRVAVWRSLDLAEPGRYDLGAAGSVEMAQADGALSLEEVAPTEGWDSSVDSDDPTDLRVTFRRGQVTWTFAGRLDSGQLQVDSGYEVASPVPPDPTG